MSNYKPIADTLVYEEPEIKYDNISSDGKVGFTEHDHKYHLIGDPGFKFSSCTGIVKNISDDIDFKKVANRVVGVKSSKYYGRDANELIKEWEENGAYYSRMGTLCHSLGERLFKGEDTTKVESLIRETEYANRIDHIKKAVSDLKKDGYSVVKTEALLYSIKLKLAGQSDLILKRTLPSGEEYYCIYDWKFLTKRLDKKGRYDARKKKYTKMKSKFNYLADCNWMHYSVQLAIYQTLTGNPGAIKEKVLIVVNEDRYELVPCYPMRVYWDNNLSMQAVYPDYRGKWWVSEQNAFYNEMPKIDGLI